MINDFLNDIHPALNGPLLAPERIGRCLGHVNAIDWSECPLAKRFNITGETNGGPRRRGHYPTRAKLAA